MGIDGREGWQILTDRVTSLRKELCKLESISFQSKTTMARIRHLISLIHLHEKLMNGLCAKNFGGLRAKKQPIGGTNANKKRGFGIA
jgi:hypothetical protein